MNKEQIEAFINWDEIPEKYRCMGVSFTSINGGFKGVLVKLELLEHVPDEPAYNLIKRPLKLKDDTWYCFTFDNPSTEGQPIPLVGKYNESSCKLYCSGSSYGINKPYIEIYDEIPKTCWGTK